MRKSIGLLLAVLIGIRLAPSFADTKEVTNDELRNIMYSLVKSYSSLDNKLERHEHRDRSSSELIKRALQSIQKGQKALEPLGGVISRLDDRINQIETMLINQQEQTNFAPSSDKLDETMEKIFKFMNENNECFNEHRIADDHPPNVQLLPDNSEVLQKIEKLSREVKLLADQTKVLYENNGKCKTNNEDVISKIEDKFANFYITQPAAAPDASKFEASVSNSLIDINHTLSALKNKLAEPTHFGLSDNDKAILQSMSNDTLSAIENAKNDLLIVADKNLSKITSRTNEHFSKLDKPLQEISDSVNDAALKNEKCCHNVNSTYVDFVNKLDVFDKFNADLLSNFNELKDKLSAPATVEAGLSDKDKFLLQSISNDTLVAIKNIKPDKNIERSSSLQKSLEEISNKIADSVATSEKFFHTVNETYIDLVNKLEVFDKFNTILMVNSEYVLDTQRKVEFASQKVIQKVGDVVKSVSGQMNDDIKKKLNDIEKQMSNNHINSVQNFSSKIESEINQVWRQIGNMHEIISESGDAINSLLGNTEKYVNGTMTTMLGMEGKVELVTSRMQEIDSNLNYLLGRLSLVTQEFNQVKAGLGQALEEIRGTLSSVKDEIKPGPGPHPISKTNRLINSLAKQNT